MNQLTIILAIGAAMCIYILYKFIAESQYEDNIKQIDFPKDMPICKRGEVVDDFIGKLPEGSRVTDCYVKSSGQYVNFMRRDINLLKQAEYIIIEYMQPAKSNLKC